MGFFCGMFSSRLAAVFLNIRPRVPSSLILFCTRRSFWTVVVEMKQSAVYVHSVIVEAYLMLHLDTRLYLPIKTLFDVDPR